MHLLKKTLTRLAIATAAITCASVSVGAPAYAEPGGGQDAKLSKIESIVDGLVPRQLSDSRIPGAIVTVVADGKTLLAKGYGTADLASDTPMDAKRTTFHTASEAKLYTAAAVLQLVEAEKLDLDADVNDYLEKFSVPDTYPGKPVTVGDLLTFTSGFDYDIYGWSQWDAENKPSLAEFAEQVMPERVREPGTYVAYNNYDYVLAGYLVELVAGQPFEEYLTEHVFEPLGMDHTVAGQPHPEKVESKLATTYRPEGGSQTETAGLDSPATPTGGSTVTSSADMAAFMLAQLDGATELGDGVAKLMQEEQFTSDDRVPGMGYGFEQRPRGGHRLVAKDGDLPGVHHNLALLPDAGVGVHVVYNGDGVDGGAFWSGKDLVNQIVDKALPSSEPKQPKNTGKDMSVYEGQYEPTRTSRLTFARVTTLTAPITVTATGDGKLSTTGLSEDPDSWTQDWVHVGEGEFAEADGQATLVFDEAGRIITSEVPNTAYERLDGLSSPTLHLLVLGFAVVILLAGLLWFPILALTHRLRGRERHPVGARLARILAWVVSVGLAMFAAGFAIVSSDPNLLMQRPLTGDLALSIALNSTSVVGILAIGLFAATATAWIRGWWTLKGRISYAVFTAATAGFLWVAVTYNLIGVPFTLTV